MALGDGTHKLALPADIRAQMGNDDGQKISVHLDERIPPTPPKRSTQ